MSNNPENFNTPFDGSVLLSNANIPMNSCSCPFCTGIPPFDPNLVVKKGQRSLISSTTNVLDLSQTFSLNSLSSANHTIYLDFTGHTTLDTLWNIYYPNASIVTPVYDTDGNRSTFSPGELQAIQEIWQRVSEDFAPFNVNVTTQEPTDINDLIKADAADTRWGVRVAIGGSSNDWYRQSAGGVAFVGSFNYSNDAPVFVFPNQLGNGNPKYTAEAASHEIGHSLGLNHDGSPTSGYYYGHGQGETGWAPIMGAGYYQNLTQWSKGEYTGANNHQDDLSIITTQNGFGYRVDDVGNTTSTAKALTINGNSVSGHGIIEQNTDVDFYSFTTSAGLIDLNINPAPIGPNLDIKVELYNENGLLLLFSNPLEQLSASIRSNLSAGIYYLKIDGVGKGDPLGTGYTDYGSLGQYFISGTISTNIGTILPTISINDVTLTEGNTGTSNATFTVSLSAAATSNVTVNYTTADGTATAGSDYTTTSGLVTFTPGQTTQTITVPVIGDTIVEPNETFFVNLTTPTNATIADNQGIGTIINDDNAGTPTLSINDVTLTEGNSGTSNATFTVSLASAATSNVTVNYATANGTATAGSDYTTTSGLVTFTPGQTTRTINVPVIGNTVSEADETFSVNLTTPTNATIADNQGIGTIINDDLPTLIINNVSIIEGNSGTNHVNFTVFLSGLNTKTVTVNYATANGTATAGSDYNSASGLVTFTPGQFTQTISVPVIGDTVVEPNETFYVNLLGVTNAVISDNQGIASITNDDVAGVQSLSGINSTIGVSITDASIVEKNSGTTNAIFTVSLSAAATSNVTLNYATANGTATTESDYLSASGRLTFSPGETSQTLHIPVLGDTVPELNETFFINLRGISHNAILTDSQGIGTILNDDLAASVGLPNLSNSNLISV